VIHKNPQHLALIAAATSIIGEPTQAAHLAATLRALGHPIRLKIIARLALSACQVAKLAEELTTPQPLISQQLRILRTAGLVTVVRSRNTAIYEIKEPALRDLLRCFSRCGA
jgi:DNA-binding transcriptional ArsR family regulator